MSKDLEVRANVRVEVDYGKEGDELLKNDYIIPSSTYSIWLTFHPNRTIFHFFLITIIHPTQ